MSKQQYNPNIPYGYCQCGCGQKTSIVNKTCRAKGRIKGEPYMFCVGHQPRLSISVRFWSKVALTANPDKCWEWQAGRSKAGYGKFGRNRETQISSRAAWELTNGVIPDGLFVLHSCDNPACVNPRHLFLGTHQDNMNDMIAKGRCNRVGLSGEKNGQCKLSDQSVLDIRKRYSQGNIHQYELAKEYGVSISSIGLIVRNRVRA